MNGINAYGYVYQNPLSHSDPLGLWVPQVAGAFIGGIAGGVSSLSVAAASGQSGWQLVQSMLIGAGTGAVVGAITLNPAAASTAGTTLIAGSLIRSAISTSLAGAASSTAAQLTTMALDPCAQFSLLQVGLSAIPGPFAMMNPLAIASRYRTGGIFYSTTGSNIAAGLQLGFLGSVRGLTQYGIGTLVNPTHSNGCECKKQ